jgi:uncharacterized protein (DUF305 family)
MSRSAHLRWRTAAFRTVLAATLLAVGVTLAACGEGDKDTDQSQTAPSSPSPSGPEEAGQFNDADVEFAQNMIPHHEQAVEMSELAATRASSPQIKQLAEQIKAAQAPEIATMTSWLSVWGKSTEPVGGHGGHTMPGMMTETDMGKLNAAEGAAFDRMFAQMMIAHHQGAIEMAKAEQADGANAKAKQLAATIAKTQQAEIATMRKLAG